MVKIHMENNNAEIAFEGNSIDLAIEISIAIGGIYRGLHNVNLLQGEVFKECIKRLVQDQNPAWKQEQDMTMIVVPTKK